MLARERPRFRLHHRNSLLGSEERDLSVVDTDADDKLIK